MPEPSPLDSGWVLSDRFEIVSVLGRGGFGIAYLASDLARRDQVVVKELAPQGAPRGEDGVVRLDPEVAPRLRQRFLEEARVLGRLNVLGVPPIRASFRENGTAYFVTEYQPDAIPLQRKIAREGPLPVEDALDIFSRLLEILEAIHQRGYLHRDVKPSNVLVSAAGHVTLIDFGAAREWLADSELTHTVLYTPGYAPPEQLSDRARRGPASDLYALCATLYHMLAGEPPPSAAERIAGAELPSIHGRRPDLEPAVARAIEQGLSLNYADRPQNAADLRDRMAEEDDGEGVRGLAAMDDKLVRLQAFSYERRACPACGGLLVEPRPLSRGRCPVCRHGLLRRREIHERLCPVCKTGVLRRRENRDPLTACPLCRFGTLTWKRRGLLGPLSLGTCGACEARFEREGDEMRVVAAGKAQPGAEGRSMTPDAWRRASDRCPVIHACDVCEGQFDELSDGRWLQVAPKPAGPYRSLYPDEWARVAANLEPNAGNAECPSCGADFYLEADRLTLLDAAEDPYGFAEGYLGRRLKVSDVAWLGAGKESPHPGVVCETCATELDQAEDRLRLERTHNRKLSRYLGEAYRLEDWHRLAQGLPLVGQEEEFRERMTETLLRAYLAGEIGFDFANHVLWRGPAIRSEDGAAGTLTATCSEIVFGTLLRKRKIPLDEIRGVYAEGDEVVLALEDGEQAYAVEPVELTAHLKSGKRTVRLEAGRLATRLEHELSRIGSRGRAPMA